MATAKSKKTTFNKRSKAVPTEVKTPAYLLAATAKTHDEKIALQPISNVVWMRRSELNPNDYNPNRMPPPEFELLAVSILEDGWLFPAIVFEEPDGTRTIIDGEHRWKESDDQRIATLTDGYVPVIFLRGTRADRLITTIRVNRSRGEHAVLPMAEIVAELLQLGLAKEDIMRRLSMEDEEVERLAERGGVPEVVSRQHKEFNKGWVPGKE